MSMKCSSVVLKDATMKALQFFIVLHLQTSFAFVHHPVFQGINQRNWCAASGYRSTEPEDATENIQIFPQIWPSIQNAPGYQDISIARGYQTDTSGSGLNAFEVNVTFSLKQTNNDHQNIIILEDDPVVVESAFFLFEKHPSESALLRVHNGMLHVIKGTEAHLKKQCNVTLVGHGNRGKDGTSNLSGYSPEDIAKVVCDLGQHIQTLSLVGCHLGSDLPFAKKLLSELRSRNVKTELHLWRSVISVSPTGEQLSMDGDVWRLGDNSNKVIAWLDDTRTLQTRVDYENRGKIVHDYKGRPLYVQILEWPTHPQMFVSAELRKKYPSIDCLEGLTWSLFFEEHGKRRAPDFIPVNGVSPVWLSNQEPKEEVSVKHITSILDLVVEIRYHARENVDNDVYYVLNNFVFKVEKRTFSTSLVGKYTNFKNQQEVQMFLGTFETQKERYTIAELRQGLEASKFNEFCRQTFQMKHCEDNCGNWGRFFMEAVFSASIRNFRTFSLFLMSVIACEVSRSKGTDESICSAFVGDDYPMVHEDPWPFHGRRGFYGCTLDDDEKLTKRERAFWLHEVVAKENFLYSRSKQMMSGVDHDQETELDIFGKVKVMNKYAFTSFVEFFRGTIEGKKLSRGCIGPSVYDPYE